MLAPLGRRHAEAALAKVEIENLSSWAQREWPTHWHVDETVGLQTALDYFLSDGLDYARTVPHLARTHEAAIARALLIGIGQSGSHPIPELEAALGVPFPPEAKP